MKNTDQELKAIKDWKTWHDDLPANDLVGLDDYYTVSFNGKTIRIPFNADTYSSIDQLLRTTIEEW